MLHWIFSDYYELRLGSRDTEKLRANAATADKSNTKTIQDIRALAFGHVLHGHHRQAIPVLYALHSLPRRKESRREMRTVSKILWSFFAAQERWDLATAVLENAEVFSSGLARDTKLVRNHQQAQFDTWRAAIASSYATPTATKLPTWLAALYRNEQDPKHVLACADTLAEIEEKKAVAAWVDDAVRERFSAYRIANETKNTVQENIAADLAEDLAWQLRSMPKEMLETFDAAERFDAHYDKSPGTNPPALRAVHALESASFREVERIEALWRQKRDDAPKEFVVGYAEWMLLGETALAVDDLAAFGSEAFHVIRSALWDFTFKCCGQSRLNAEFRYVAYRWLTNWAVAYNHVDTERLADNARIERKLAFE